MSQIEELRAYCYEGFLAAIAEGDLEVARTWLMTLAEYTLEIDSELIVYRSLCERHQVAQDTCEEHGTFCCSLCFDVDPRLFESGDPADELEGKPMTIEAHGDMCWMESQEWEAHADHALRLSRDLLAMTNVEDFLSMTNHDQEV